MSNPEGLRIAEQLIAEEAVRRTGELDLADLGLTLLPPQISGLPHLRTLRLSRPPWRDVRPGREELGTNSVEHLDRIASLKNLRELGVARTQVADLGPLAGLTSLQVLDCSHTYVADLTPLTGITSLRDLDCSHTQIADLAPLVGIISLTRLACGRTQVTDLTPLDGFKELNYLNFWGTGIADLTPVAGLVSLEALVCWSSLVDNLRPLAGLFNLRHLDCDRTRVADLAPLAHLKSFRHLECQGTKVADLSPLAGCVSLEYLDCSQTQVADLKPLVGLTNLRRFHCRGTQVADLAPVAGIETLRLLDAREASLRSLPRELGYRTGLLPDGLQLDGNELEPPLPTLIAQGQPDATRLVLAWLRGEPVLDSLAPPDPAAEADDPPALPAPGAGPAVVFAADGRLSLAAAHDLDATGSNRKRLEALHPALRESAVELRDALQTQPTNQRNDRLIRAAERYCGLVDRPLEKLDFALLYAAGIQLENADRATRAALDAGRADVPDLTPVQDECLGALLQLHPPFILASRDGTEMLADQTLIQLTAQDVAVVQDSGLAIGNALIERPDLAEPALGEMIRDSAAEIGQGPNPQRDAATTISMTRNVIIAVGAGATAISLPLVVGSVVAGPAGAVAGGAGAWFLLKTVEKTKAFSAVQAMFAARLDKATEADWAAAASRLRGHRALLLSLEPPLRRMAKLPAFAWVDRTLDWIKRQPDGDREP